MSQRRTELRAIAARDVREVRSALPPAKEAGGVIGAIIGLGLGAGLPSASSNATKTRLLQRLEVSAYSSRKSHACTLARNRIGAEGPGSNSNGKKRSGLRRASVSDIVRF